MPAKHFHVPGMTRMIAIMPLSRVRHEGSLVAAHAAALHAGGNRGNYPVIGGIATNSATVALHILRFRVPCPESVGVPKGSDTI